jgi:hypothetical protein
MQINISVSRKDFQIIESSEEDLFAISLASDIQTILDSMSINDQDSFDSTFDSLASKLSLLGLSDEEISILLA